MNVNDFLNQSFFEPELVPPILSDKCFDCGVLNIVLFSTLYKLPFYLFYRHIAENDLIQDHKLRFHWNLDVLLTFFNISIVHFLLFVELI